MALRRGSRSFSTSSRDGRGVSSASALIPRDRGKRREIEENTKRKKKKKYKKLISGATWRIVGWGV